MVIGSEASPAGGVVHGVGDRGGDAHDPDLTETLDPHGVELVRLADESEPRTSLVFPRSDRYRC